MKRTYIETLWMLCQKLVSMAGTSNYIPHILWDVITCPCLWYLLLEQHNIEDHNMTMIQFIIHHVQAEMEAFEAEKWEICHLLLCHQALGQNGLQSCENYHMIKMKTHQNKYKGQLYWDIMQVSTVLSTREGHSNSRLFLSMTNLISWDINVPFAMKVQPKILSTSLWWLSARLQ